MIKKIHKAYSDPTADIAIGHVMCEEKKRFKKRVFICSPFAGQLYENIINAKRYCLYAVNHGYAPFAPHLMYPRFMDDDNPRQRDEAIRCGISFLYACHELWVFGKDITRGMHQEIECAKKRNIPIYYFNEQCCRNDTIGGTRNG